MKRLRDQVWIPSTLIWTACTSALTILTFLSGASLISSFLAALVVVAMAVPAGFWWISIRSGQASVIEFVGMGLAISIAFEMLVIAFAGSIGIRAVPWWLISLIFIAGLIPHAIRSHKKLDATWRPPTVSHRELWAGFIGIVAGGTLLVQSLQRVKLPGEVPLNLVIKDIYLFGAVGNDTARAGINGSGILDGVGVRYHWLSYAWSDWICGQSGLSNFDTSVRFAPAVALISMVGLVAGWLLRPSRNGSGIVLGTLAVVVGTGLDFAITGKFIVGAPDNFTPASQILGCVMLVALVLVTTRFILQQPSPVLLLVIAGLAAVIMGTKVSLGVMSCFGICLVAATQIGRGRRRLMAAVTATFTIGVTCVLVFVLMESGQSSAGLLNWKSSLIWHESSAISAAYGLIVTGSISFGTQIAKWLGVGYLMASPRFRFHPITAWGISGIAFVTLSFLTIGADNNAVWFPEAGSLIASLSAAFGVAMALRILSKNHDHVRTRTIVLLGAFAGLATALTALLLTISKFGSSRPYITALVPLAVAMVLAWLIFRHRNLKSKLEFWVIFSVVGLCAAVSMPFVVFAYRSAVSPTVPLNLEHQDFFGEDAILDSKTSERAQDIADAESAARWLAAVAGPSDLVATAQPTTTWLPALTRLRMYATNPERVADWMTAGSLSEFNRRQQLVEDFARTGSAQAEGSLCADGVSWIWYGTRELPLGIKAVHSDGRVSIVRICSNR